MQYLLLCLLMDIYQVEISKKAQLALMQLPTHIVFKLQMWIAGINNHGLHEMRKIPVYHDEPLKGKRNGQRSIRLNRAYRAIYVENTDGTIQFIEIIEVNKHDY